MAKTLNEQQAEILARFERLIMESRHLFETYRSDTPEYHQIRTKIDDTIDEADAAGISPEVIFAAELMATARPYRPFLSDR